MRIPYCLMKYKSKGLIRNIEETVLGKQCSCCHQWYPETSEFFFRNGKSSGYSADHYCKFCRALKEDVAREKRKQGLPRQGLMEAVKKGFEEGRFLPVHIEYTMVAVLPEGVDLDADVLRRNPEDVENFILIRERLVNEAASGSEDAKKILEDLKVKFDGL